jgi:hypothetical protein
MYDGDQGCCGIFTTRDTQYIDHEEASIPSLTFHDAYGNQIDWDEYNRLADLELEHAASGTLHLLYPDLYEEPVEKRDPDVDWSNHVDKEFHGE